MHSKFTRAVILLSFVFICAQATTIPRTAPSSLLFPRQLLAARATTCTDSSSTPCNITGASYCCPSGNECIPLENNTAVICCKIGDICDRIHPTPCPAQESSSNGTNTKQLPKCGSQCCPVGFECDLSGEKCLMKAENIPEKYKNGTSNGGEKPGSDAAIQKPVHGDSSANTVGDRSCADFPGKAIVVGFFPGFVAGALLLFLWLKAVEARTRRRSIKSFGALPSLFPSENNLAEKNIPKKPSFPAGFASQQPPPQRQQQPPRQQQPQQHQEQHRQQQQQSQQLHGGSYPEDTYSPLSFSFRSPNLGPIVLPFGGTTQEQTSRQGNFTPLAPRPASIQTVSDLSSRRDSNATSISIAFSDSAGPVLDLLAAPKDAGWKRKSVQTGYSASLYIDGNESRPFVFDPRNEVAVPPVPKPAPLFYRQAGGPLPRPPIPGWAEGRV